MGLARYMVLSGLRNKNMWFWGFAWMLMWIIFGAFFFSRDFAKIPSPYLGEAARFYTADWAAGIATYEPTGFLVGLLYTLVYQTGGIAYLRRYGKLTPGRLIYSYYLAMVIPSLALSSLLMALTVSLFYVGFRYQGLDVSISSFLPKEPAPGLAEVLGLSVLASLFTQALLFLMAVAALNVSPKHVGRLAFIPMMLVFVSFYAYMFLDMPDWAILANPFMAIQGAIAAVYGGMGHLPSHLVMGGNGPLDIGKAVPLYYDVISIIAWTALLTALSIPLILRIKYRPAEELREL